MNELDKYVGKDIWVKVYNRYLNDQFYIRVNASEPSEIGETKVAYVVNIIPACFVEHSWSARSNSSRYKNYLSDTWKFHGDFLEILYPVEVLDTEELTDVVSFDEEDY